MKSRQADLDVALRWSVEMGLLLQLDLILKFSDTNVNAKYRGLSLLHIAIKPADGNELSVLTRLLEDARIDVNAKDREDQTPLSDAARHGRTDAFKVVLADRRVDVVAPSSYFGGLTVLHMAFFGNDTELLEVMLADERVDKRVINKGDDRGKTPLHVACSQTSCARQMLDLFLADPRVEVNKCTANLRRETSLHLVCAANVNAVEALLANERIDVSIRNGSGHTALEVARARGCQEIVDIMLEDGRAEDAVHQPVGG